MKKIIILPLLFLSFAQANADMLPPTTICQDNGWTEIFVAYKNKPDFKRKPRLSHYSAGFETCILPDGNYYNPWRLEREKNNTYKELFDQYSGKSPTFEQVEKVKKEFRKQGYIVE